MESFRKKVTQSSAAAFTEALTSSTGNHLIGFHAKGCFAGPHLVAAGHDPVARLVFERILNLPTLGWMRGSLSMIVLDKLGHQDTMRWSHLGAAEPADDVVFIPYDVDENHHQMAADEGYWTILHKCRNLGMIEGRGLRYLKSGQ